MNNRVKTYTNGDIDVTYKGEYYEFDCYHNRYYQLAAGALSSPDGSLVKRRIGKKVFESIMKKTDK